jgi:signal transduction histidine kinase
LAAIASAVGFATDIAAGVLVLASSAAFGAVFFAFTRARYRNLAHIVKQIDLVLHNADRIELDDFDEGELSILKNEITKMTVRIREQNDALKKEKKHLADSLADIAHQLRTPLTSADIILSFLREDIDEKDRRAFASEMGDLLAGMDWLITSLLKLSRLDAGVVEFQRERIKVSDLIEVAVRPLQIPMELRGVRLRTDILPEAAICGDTGWLAEAMRNIIKNCMENTGEGGSIEIACDGRAQFTELSVRDSGAGFEGEDLPRLFDRFYRGKGAPAAGYGIGLSLSKTIIEHHGGTVKARNHPDGGAVFTVRFPK